MSTHLFKIAIHSGLFICLSIFIVACFFEQEPEIPAERIFNRSQWTNLAPCPTPAVFATGFSIEATQKAYVGLGVILGPFVYPHGRAFLPSNQFFEYDPEVNRWEFKKPYPGGHSDSNLGLSTNNKGYIIKSAYIIEETSGQTTTKIEFWEYDPIKDEWTKRPAVPGAENRYGAVGFSINNKLYVGLGYDGVIEKPEFGVFQVNPLNFLTDFYEYTPETGQWKTIKSFPASGRIDAMGFSVNGKGYVIGGRKGDNPEHFMNDVWEYDPVMDKWEQKENLPRYRGRGVAFSLQGKGYVGACYDTSFLARSDFWIFDPIKNENAWQRDSIPIPERYYPVGFSLQGKGYLGLGSTTQSPLRFEDNLGLVNDFWVYTLYSTR